MALLDYVNMETATGLAHEVIEMGRYDKHSPYLEIRLNNPGVVRAQRAYEDALFDAGRVDETTFELIMVAVA